MKIEPADDERAIIECSHQEVQLMSSLVCEALEKFQEKNDSDIRCCYLLAMSILTTYWTIVHKGMYMMDSIEEIRDHIYNLNDSFSATMYDTLEKEGRIEKMLDDVEKMPKD